MACYVVDTSVFICKLPLAGQIVTVPGVACELKDTASQIFFQQSDVTVESPGTEALRLVREAAFETRDEERLSRVDVELLAKALECRKRCVLVTDDYAVQNLAHRLRIQVKNILQPRIRKAVKWGWECMGCLRVYPENTECPVCGSPLKRKRQKEKHLKGD